MRAPVTRHLFRLEASELKKVMNQVRDALEALKVIEQSYYDYDVFIKCSLDDNNRFVKSIFCFDDVGMAVIHYSNGDVELVTQDQYYCSYSISDDNDNN